MKWKNGQFRQFEVIDAVEELVKKHGFQSVLGCFKTSTLLEEIKERVEECGDKIDAQV